MPAKIETMKVRLNTDDKWEMKAGSGPWQLPPNYPSLEVSEDQVGVFSYEIIGSGNVAFDAVAPFVQKAGANPQKSDFNNQFIVLGKGTRELTVIDVNGMKDGNGYSGDTYEYELRFTESAPPLDPIITNRGCCNSFAISSTEAVVYSLALASAGALAALGFRKWRANRPPLAASGPLGRDPKGL